MDGKTEMKPRANFLGLLIGAGVAGPGIAIGVPLTVFQYGPLLDLGPAEAFTLTFSGILGGVLVAMVALHRSIIPTPVVEKPKREPVLKPVVAKAKKLATEIRARVAEKVKPAEEPEKAV